MKKINPQLDTLSDPVAIDLETALGVCAVARTTDPFVMPDIFTTACLVILGDWLPASTPVGMVITYREYVPAGESELAREVGTVFAAKEFRGHPNANGQTLPVAVGTWLFDHKYLTLHSPDRTPAGERWARAVGGRCPPLDQRGSEAAALESGQAALARVSQERWPAPPWPRA